MVKRIVGVCLGLNDVNALKMDPSQVCTRTSEWQNEVERWRLIFREVEGCVG